jgi:hypothetical protein
MTPEERADGVVRSMIDHCGGNVNVKLFFVRETLKRIVAEAIQEAVAEEGQRILNEAANQTFFRPPLLDPGYR